MVVLICHGVPAGPVANANRGARPDLPGPGPGAPLVPLPGHLPGGGRHHRPHPGGPAGSGLPHNEGDPTAATAVGSSSARLRLSAHLLVLQNRVSPRMD